MAGEIKATPVEQPKIHAELKILYDKLAVLIEKGEEEYDNYVMHIACPFLSGKLCNIYQIRPEGCRRFPDTAFALLSEDCEALNRLKKQRTALKRGRTTKETYCSTEEPIKSAKLSDKQYRNCIDKLLKVGITEDERDLFEVLNECNKRKK